MANGQSPQASGAIAQQAPTASDSPPPRRTRVDTWEGFEAELTARKDRIVPLLPANISWERFKSTATAAIRQTPDLLDATPQSLFGALTKAAQDGMLPDGREGVITVYNVKAKVKIPGTNAVEERYEKRAQWNPMLYGLRRRARELDNLVVDAQAVYANDKFVRRQGDDPAIIHEPAPLGVDRGALIGAYAIFKDATGTILHREVMDKTQIEAVRGQSRNSNGLLWTTFQEEGYRKTVIRRGFKTLPVSEKLEAIVRRDDENFTFSAPAIEGEASAQVATQARPALAGPPKAPPPVAGSRSPAGAVVDNAGLGDDSSRVGAGRAANVDVVGAEPIDTGDPAANDLSPLVIPGDPPGVNHHSQQVTDYAAFAGWVKDALAGATDPSALWDTWESRIEPWRDRMPPDWFTALKGIQKERLDGMMEIPAELRR